MVRFAVRHAPAGQQALAILVPPLLLAATRSVAVWSSSGLETRLFELLIVASTLRLLSEDRLLLAGDPGRKVRKVRKVRNWAALGFALATLTRPDGLLIAAAAFAAVGLVRWRDLRSRLTWTALSGVSYTAIVGAHYLFRWFYYGDWLPNTYYAKVSGEFWWERGGSYFEAFAIEYALYLWIPLLLAAIVYHRRRGSLLIPIVFAAVCLPHAVYVASVGGDHFEHRPLDLSS